jgi:hypothetical protein
MWVSSDGKRKWYIFPCDIHVWFSVIQDSFVWDMDKFTLEHGPYVKCNSTRKSEEFQKKVSQGSSSQQKHYSYDIVNKVRTDMLMNRKPTSHFQVSTEERLDENRAQL